MAVAVGAGGITSTATDDDDKPNMLRAGSAVLDVLAGDQMVVQGVQERMFCHVAPICSRCRVAPRRPRDLPGGSLR